jgi:hypothetical protein
MEDSTANLEKLSLDEYRSDIQALEALISKVAKQATITKRSFVEMDKAVAVLGERIKWIWWVVAAILGALAYLAQGLFSWGLGKL